MLQGEELKPPSPVTLIEWFENVLETNQMQAAQVGLHIEDDFVSYTDLNARANSVARKLREYFPPDLPVAQQHLPIVAVDLDPSLDLVVVLLAILKLGAAYLPVDSRDPVKHLHYILEDAKPLCVVTYKDSPLTTDGNTLWTNYTIIGIHSIFENVTGTVTQENLRRQEKAFENSTFAVLYTSGSTGRPKGVRLQHRNVINRINWQLEKLPFSTGEVACFKTTLLFVDSVSEIFAPLLKMVPLSICPKGVIRNPEAFISFLSRHHVSRLVLVPSLLHNMLTYLSANPGKVTLPSLTTWVCSGETLPASLLGRFFDTFPGGKKMINSYGSTEVMGDVVFETFESMDDVAMKCKDGMLSIGVPLANCNVYILDDKLRPVSGNDEGEIFVSGLNVTSGYLNTAQNEAFINNHLNKDPQHATLYRTGDFGSISKDAIIFGGRNDSQMKVGGKKVSLPEIERVILESGLATRVVVLCHKMGEVASVLVAYVSYASDVTTLGERAANEQVRAACLQSLPEYMCPTVVHVEEFPFLPHTGKIDRGALQKIYQKSFSKDMTRANASLDERSGRVLRVISQNLYIPTHAIPRCKSFFELGGNSINMISTMSQLKKENLHISFESFTQARTIQDILDAITEAAPSDNEHQSARFRVSPLKDVGETDKQHLRSMVMESKTAKHAIGQLLGATYDDWLNFNKESYEAALISSTSLALYDQESGRLVGASLCLDQEDNMTHRGHNTPARLAPFEALIRRLLEFADLLGPEYKCRGKIVFHGVMCIDPSLSPADMAAAAHTLEAAVPHAARDQGYKGVLATNSNPVTAQLCINFLGYQELGRISLKDFEYCGRKVFAHAGDDIFPNCTIRYL